jgi:hypothetical protein
MLSGITRRFARLTRWTSRFHGERGQTTAEYVAITAVGVTLAVGVVFGLLQTELTGAVGDIGTKLTTLAGEGGGGDDGGGGNPTYVSGDCTGGSWGTAGSHATHDLHPAFTGAEPANCTPDPADGPQMTCTSGWWEFHQSGSYWQLQVNHNNSGNPSPSGCIWFEQDHPAQEGFI